MTAGTSSPFFALVVQAAAPLAQSTRRLLLALSVIDGERSRRRGDRA
jgi:hypothetical protein